MTLKNLGKEKLLSKIVAAAALAWLLAVMVGCTNNADAATPKHESPSKPEEPKYLASRVGYDELKLHGKFRQYQVDTTKGDKTATYSDGKKDSAITMPEGLITTKDGKTIETPVYWSRVPLSIQSTAGTTDDDVHCANGLYSIHNKGTSLIFPNTYSADGTRDDTNNRQCTSGVYVAFATDSSNIKLHYRYTSTNTGRGRSGIDIYEIDENGTPQFKQNLKKTDKTGTLEYKCKEDASGETSAEFKKFMVVLPTYTGFEFKEENAVVDDQAGTSGLTFEFDKGAKTYEIEVFNESKQKPILIYGTSITQGDGNSNLRPGATYAAQIMFAAKREVINCGFAGSAQMEYKMADFLSNIDAEVFVIDPGWNLTGSGGSCSSNGAPANITDAEVVARAKYMVRKYREKHPNTPIVMCPKFLKRSDGCQNSNPQSLVSGVTLPTNIDTHSCYFSREGLLLYKAYLELKDPSCCPDEAGKKETPVQNLFWAKQNATSSEKTAANNYVNCTDLHPCVNGMNSIANFILGCFNENVRSVYTGGKFDAPEQCATCNKGHATN